MLLTPHMLMGAAVATVVPNSILAVPLSFGLHFLGDLIPHWDFYSKTTHEQKTTGWRPIAVMAELGLAVAVSMTATLFAMWVLHDSSLALRIFLCCGASILPDMLEAPAIFYKNGEENIFTAIKNVQSKLQVQIPLPWGILTQILVAGVAVYIFLSAVPITTLQQT